MNGRIKYYINIVPAIVVVVPINFSFGIMRESYFSESGCILEHAVLPWRGVSS